MTIDELFGVLKQMKWKKENGTIRLQGPELAPRVCPLSAACNHINGTSYTLAIYTPAERIGLSSDDASIVADAADVGATSEYASPAVKELRERMERELL